MSDLIAKLAAPFGANDLEFKPQTIGVSSGKPWCQIVPYVAARAVYQRLDECFGVFGWSMDVRPEKIADAEGVIATLTIYDPVNGRMVTREDGSEPSDIDSYKGAISGAVKRVAVTLGIGRYLYDLDGPIYALIHEGGKHRAKGKTKRGEEYDFKWDVPPNILAQMLGVTQDGEVMTPAKANAVYNAPREKEFNATPKADIPRPRSVEVTKVIPEVCPKCGGPVWDNRENKKNPKGPDWTCKDKECKTGNFVTAGWAEKTGAAPKPTKSEGAGPGMDRDVPPPEDPDDGDLPF